MASGYKGFAQVNREANRRLKEREKELKQTQKENTMDDKLKKDILFLLGLQSAKDKKESTQWDINLFKASFFNKIKSLDKKGENNTIDEALTFLRDMSAEKGISDVFTSGHQIWGYLSKENDWKFLLKEKIDNYDYVVSYNTNTRDIRINYFDTKTGTKNDVVVPYDRFGSSGISEKLKSKINMKMLQKERGWHINMKMADKFDTKEEKKQNEFEGKESEFPKNVDIEKAKEYGGDLLKYSYELGQKAKQLGRERTPFKDNTFTSFMESLHLNVGQGTQYSEQWLKGWDNEHHKEPVSIVSETIYDPFNIDNPDESYIDETYDIEKAKKLYAIFEGNRQKFLSENKFPSYEFVKMDGEYKYNILHNGKSIGKIDLSRGMDIVDYIPSEFQTLKMIKEYLSKEYISKEAQDIIEPEWNKMRDFLGLNTTENMFTDTFFENNPSKILGEAIESTNKWGKKIMIVKGSMDNINSIDVPEVLEPQQVYDPFLSEIEESVQQVIINPENTENIDFAVNEEEKKIAKQVIKRASKKKVDNTVHDEIDVDLFSFDDILKTLNPQISEEEIECWVSWNYERGNRLGGEWEKYNVGANNEQLKKERIEKGLLAYNPRTKNTEPSCIYYAGNVYEKISDLLQNKDMFKYGIEQWEKQFKGLNEINNKKLSLTSGNIEERLIIQPISDIAKTFKINSLSDGTIFEEPRTLISAFLDYIRQVPESDFELPVRPYDIEYRYIKNEGDRSQRVSKEEKFEKKKNARLEGDRLFQKFLYDELTLEDKNKLEQYWNGKYNSWIDINYNKIPVAFECSKIFKKGKLSIRPAQREAVAFQSVNNCGILAYDVGVGKTASLIFIIAQQMQSNQCKRPLIIVPNPTYEKWKAEFKGVFDKSNRMIGSGILPQYEINDYKNLGVDFISEIFDKEGKFIEPKDYSISIMTYEALEKIGFNEEKNRDFIVELMNVLDNGSDSSKARDIAVIKQKAEGLLGKAQKDTVVDFDMFGFDFIGIDEAHNMKNVFTSVKGDEKGTKGQRETSHYEIRGSVSARGIKAFFMSQFIFKKTNGKNVCLLTATPFTNNPLEVYSMLALTSYVELKKRGIGSLKEFFDTYVKQSYEVVYGSDFQFKEKAVIKQWNNRVSLQSLIFSFINYKSGEDAGIKRPNKIVLPMFKESINGNAIELPEDRQVSTFLTPTSEQLEYLKEIESFVLKEANLSDICIYDGSDESCVPNDELVTLSNLSDEEAEKGRTLRGLSFARQVTLSPYLYACNNRCATDKAKPNFYKIYIETSPKLSYVMQCIKSVKQWHDNKGEKPSGQIIYMDAGKEYFKHIKEYLIKEIGYHADEVEIITSDVSQNRRESIKSGFLNGDILIVIGTSSIKEGIDLQDRTSVLYNCWLDWRPTDIKQLEGRAWRFGNKYANVRIVTPLLENSIDPFMFQKLEEKTARINDIFDRAGRKNVLDIEEFNPEELKLGLITDPVKKANETIRMQSKDYENGLKKVESKIEGISEIVSIQESVKWYEKNIIEKAKYKYNWLIQSYSNREIEVRKEDGQIEYKTINAEQELLEKGVTKDSINIIDLAIVFGKYYDKLTRQSEFSYYTNQWKDQRKKLVNFERSILEPRGLSLQDDLSIVKQDLEKEKSSIQLTIEALKSNENRSAIVEKFNAELKQLNSKRKTVVQRVDEFKSLNEKCLSALIDYNTEQVKQVEKHELVSEMKAENETEKANLKSLAELVSEMIAEEKKKKVKDDLNDYLELLNEMINEI